MSTHTIEVTATLSDAELSAVCGAARTRNPQKAVAQLVKHAVERAAAESILHPDTLRSVRNHEAGRVRWARNADELFATLRAEVAAKARKKAA